MSRSGFRTRPTTAGMGASISRTMGSIRDPGTIRLRAVVANGSQFLTPGMFGNMRLSTGVAEPALLVPDSAVSTDQARKIVMVAGRDGSLTPHPVTVGPVIDGLRVIRSGLAPDQIVISGAQLVLPGMKAKTQPGKIVAQASAAAAPDTVAAPISGEATFAGR